MKDRIILIVMIVSLAFNLGVLGLFIFRAIGIANRPLENPDKMAHRLGLTDEQQEEIRCLREEMEKGNIPLHKQMKDKRGEVAELFKQDEVNMDERDALFTDIAMLQMEIEIATFDNMFAAKSKLTPEQQEKFCKMIEEGVGPGKGRGGRGGPPFIGKGGMKRDGPGMGRPGRGSPGFPNGPPEGFPPTDINEDNTSNDEE